MSDSGKAVGTSSVRVSRQGGEVVIEEHASPMEESESTRRALDATTYALRSYSDDSGGTNIVAISISGETATIRQSSKTIEVAASPGAPLAVFDFFVGLYFHLPATLHAARASRLSMLPYGNDKTEPATISAGSRKRPPGVPDADASLDMTYGGGTATLWYDPKTFVLDECDFPAQRIQYRREAFSAGDSTP